jgi:ArsR family transcriptional regulator
MSDSSDTEQECCPPARDELGGPVEGEEAESELAGMAEALGHPVRVGILRILTEREECICGELVEELPVAQSTVSQHLKKLKDADWIRGAVDGPRTCYCIEPAALERFGRLFESILEFDTDGGTA